MKRGLMVKKLTFGKIKKVSFSIKSPRNINLKLILAYVCAVILFTIFISWVVLANTISSSVEVFNGNSVTQIALVPQISHDSQFIVLLGCIISMVVLISLIIFLVRIKK